MSAHEQDDHDERDGPDSAPAREPARDPSTLPGTPADAAPRESIEIRTMMFWD